MPIRFAWKCLVSSTLSCASYTLDPEQCLQKFFRYKPPKCQLLSIAIAKSRCQTYSQQQVLKFPFQKSFVKMVTLNELSSEFSNTAMLSTDDDLEDGEIFDDEEESDYFGHLDKETRIGSSDKERISRDEKLKHYLHAETYKRNFNDTIHHEVRRQSEFVSKVGPRHEIRRPMHDLGHIQHEEKMPKRDWPRKDAEQRSY